MESIQNENKCSTSSSAFKIFVGGLSADTTDASLSDYFSKFGGKLVSCKVKKWSSDSSKCKGFAMIEAKNKSMYDQILNAQHQFKGRYIECKKAIQNRKDLQNQTTHKVFITGIQPTVTDEQLRTFLARMVDLEMVYIVRKNNNHQGNCIAYATLKSAKDKELLIGMKNLTIEGRRLYCVDYQSKADLCKQSKKQRDAAPIQDHQEGDSEIKFSKESPQKGEEQANEAKGSGQPPCQRGTWKSELMKQVVEATVHRKSPPEYRFNLELDDGQPPVTHRRPGLYHCGIDTGFGKRGSQFARLEDTVPTLRSNDSVGSQEVRQINDSNAATGTGKAIHFDHRPSNQTQESGASSLFSYFKQQHPCYKYGIQRGQYTGQFGNAF